MFSQSKADEAVACLADGFNCAQSVFSTYCGEFGVDEKTALLVSCGLGGGMGRLQETCGAVSGAYLLIGLKYGKFIKSDDNTAKDKTYEMVRKFDALFRERHQTTCCRELLDFDLLNGDKQEGTERTKIICPQFVRDAAEIIEELLFSDEIN